MQRKNGRATNPLIAIDFPTWCIFIGGLWCAGCAVASALGLLVATLCTSPEIAQCGERGFQAGQQWAKIGWLVFPLFAFGAWNGLPKGVPVLRAARCWLFRVRQAAED